jgi:hypothetical protein
MTEDQVKKEIRKILERLEVAGDVIYFDRLQSGLVKTQDGSYVRMCRNGTSDFICVIKNRSASISIIFIEAKNSEGGVWSEAQRQFAQQYAKPPYIHYFLVSDPSKLAGQILDIAYDRLQDIHL